MQRETWKVGRNLTLGCWESLSLNPARGTAGCAHLQHSCLAAPMWVHHRFVFPTSLCWTVSPPTYNQACFLLTSGRSKSQRPDGTSNLSSLIQENAHSFRSWISKLNSPVPPFHTGLKLVVSGFVISQMPDRKDTGSPLKNKALFLHQSVQSGFLLLYHKS